MTDIIDYRAGLSHEAANALIQLATQDQIPNNKVISIHLDGRDGLTLEVVLEFDGKPVLVDDDVVNAFITIPHAASIQAKKDRAKWPEWIRNDEGQAPSH